MQKNLTHTIDNDTKEKNFNSPMDHSSRLERLIFMPLARNKDLSFCSKTHILVLLLKNTADRFSYMIKSKILLGFCGIKTFGLSSVIWKENIQKFILKK
ncbi:hypothetical protein BpHYR1_047846 [Brachionus plicatilis]|uniref:Uncharacterized protein n=1 Tax=Brachionus plicatilis TaxID=10195 RepID=A0A3M7PIL9_BRAPC|nr:hypothetical protein BpHYR1_047846 [Brachionus plicatilis]